VPNGLLLGSILAERTESIRIGMLFNTLGTRIGSLDNPGLAADDRFNRRQFDESMEVIRLALDNESFSFHGEFHDRPAPGIPDRGGFVERLNLVPRHRAGTGRRADTRSQHVHRGRPRRRGEIGQARPR